MPHAGLMNERDLGPVEGPFQRARLHIRGGRRRLRQGKIAAGIATLHDALSAALEWYAAVPERRARLAVLPGEVLHDDRTAYAVLVRSGVLDGAFDYDAFDRLAVRSFTEDLREADHAAVMAGIERIMTALGIMPFDEAALPPEDPSTF